MNFPTSPFNIGKLIGAGVVILTVMLLVAGPQVLDRNLILGLAGALGIAVVLV